MGDRFRAAAAAMHVVHDKSLNLATYERLIHQAGGQGVRLLVLPEASLQGFLFHLNHGFDPGESEYHWENGEPVPGPSTEIIAGWAAQEEMHVVFGMMELVEHPATPVLHNSSVPVIRSPVALRSRERRDPPSRSGFRLRTPRRHHRRRWLGMDHRRRPQRHRARGSADGAGGGLPAAGGGRSGQPEPIPTISSGGCSFRNVAARALADDGRKAQRRR